MVRSIRNRAEVSTKKVKGGGKRKTKAAEGRIVRRAKATPAVNAVRKSPRASRAGNKKGKRKAPSKSKKTAADYGRVLLNACDEPGTAVSLPLSS